MPRPSLFDPRARASLIFAIGSIHSRGLSLLVKDFHPHARNKNLLLSTCRQLLYKVKSGKTCSPSRRKPGESLFVRIEANLTGQQNFVVKYSGESRPSDDGEGGGGVIQTLR